MLFLFPSIQVRVRNRFSLIYISFFYRKQYCQSCKAVACSNCLAYKITLPGSKKKLTSCKRCFVDQKSSIEGLESFEGERKASSAFGAAAVLVGKSIGVVGKGIGAAGKGVGAVGKGVGAGVGAIGKGIGGVGEGAVSLLTRHSIKEQQFFGEYQEGKLFPPSERAPWYLYFSKPFTRYGSRLEVGRVFVRVVEAQNLPNMDTFGLTDAFFKISLDGSHVRTDIINDCLNPKWENASFILSSTQGDSILSVRCFDADQMSTKKIGTIAIPLTTISHGVHFQKWFDLDLDEKVKKKLVLQQMKKNGKMKTEDLNAIEENLSLDEIDVESISRSDHPRVLLELCYEYSSLGEFFSYFDEKPITLPPQPEFQITLLRDVCFRLLDQLSPLTWTMLLLVDVIFWKDPLKSALTTSVVLLCCAKPWLFPTLACLVLLHDLVSEYLVSLASTKSNFVEPGVIEKSWCYHSREEELF